MTEEAATHFDWTSRVRPHSEPGLSSCVAEGRLTLDGRRVAVTPIDLYALRLAEWAIGRRQSLILCPPEPFGALPALVAAAAHVASIVEGFTRTGRYLGSDRRVAVVTASRRIRGVYRRLGIGSARLFDVAPAATRTGSGGLSVLGGHDRGGGWSTIFLSDPSELRSVGRLDLTVIECPVASDCDLGRLEGPLILIANDPADGTVTRLARELPVFAWCDEDLAGLGSMRISDGSALVEDRLRLECAAAGIRCEPTRVPDQRICENAALFWADIGPLLRAARRSMFGRELAASAFVLFYDLMHLALPTAVYEAATHPLRVRIREIEAARRLVDGDLRETYVPMVALELEDLAAAIGARPPKTDVLLSTLEQQTAAARTVLLVVRTAELARIYREYLSTLGDLARGARVTSLWGVAGEAPADVAVIAGLLPGYARYIYTTGIAAEIVVLGYDSESPLTSVPGGFTEHTQIQRAVSYQREHAAWLAREAAKAACWSALSGEPSTIVDDRPDPPRIETRADGVAPAPAAPETPPGLWDGATGSFERLERRLARDEPPRLAPDAGSTGLEVVALRVEFADGRWTYLEAGSFVTRWRVGAAADAAHPVSGVAVGDELLFVDGQARKDLLAKILEVAEGVPELAVPAAWVDYWRGALTRARARFATYELLRAELERHGCVRQAQTVRLWVTGQTIGPEDPEDVRRLGECLGDEPLIRSYRTVADAMRGLRTAHVRLGQRVGALARSVGANAAAGLVDEDEIIDERTGLTASDFRDSIEILIVRTVQPAGTVPYAVTGVLRPADEREEQAV